MSPLRRVSASWNDARRNLINHLTLYDREQP